MDPQPNENFFELKVSQEGSEQMIRVYKVVKWIFAGSIVMSALYLILTYLRFSLFKMYEKDTEYLGRLEGYIYPVYSIVWNLIFVTQIYCYFHFTGLCKKAIDLRQAELFNHSFKWLLRCAILNIVILVIEFALALFEVYVSLQFLKMYSPAT